MNNTTSASLNHPGNPLLYSSLTINVKPYWFHIAEAFALLLFGRFLKKCNPCKDESKRTWFTATEIFYLNYGLKFVNVESKDQISELGPFKNEISRLVSLNKFGFLDLYKSLKSITQVILIFVRQSGCLSSNNGSLWKCYNAFGYDLFNYVSMGLFRCSIIWLIKRKNPEKSFVQKITMVSMYICVFLSILFLSYIITNVIPMLFIYSSLLCPVALAIYVTYIGLAMIGYHFAGINIHFKWWIYVSYFLAAADLYFLIIAPIAFNYSQYFYFGETFSQTIIDEYRSRDTQQWMLKMKTDVQQQIHTILSLF